MRVCDVIVFDTLLMGHVSRRMRSGRVRIFNGNHGKTLSRVCAVAQYAVLETNAKVNGRGPFLHPHPFEAPQPISMSCQIYYYVPKGVDEQN